METLDVEELDNKIIEILKDVAKLSNDDKYFMLDVIYENGTYHNRTKEILSEMWRQSETSHDKEKSNLILFYWCEYPSLLSKEHYEHINSYLDKKYGT
jgi:hypothetical protein